MCAFFCVLRLELNSLNGFNDFFFNIFYFLFDRIEWAFADARSRLPTCTHWPSIDRNIETFLNTELKWWIPASVLLMYRHLVCPRPVPAVIIIDFFICSWLWLVRISLLQFLISIDLLEQHICKCIGISSESKHDYKFIVTIFLLRFSFFRRVKWRMGKKTTKEKEFLMWRAL